MAANPDNASIWTDADVYIATDLNATQPADAGTPFNGSWTLVGLLDGTDGFEETRTEDINEHFAWGGILVRTSRKNFKLEKKFSVLEDNATTRALIWPGSSDTQLVVPKPAKVLIAFETREGGKVRRLITHNYAQVEVAGNVLDNEADLKKVQLVAKIYPSVAGVLFDVQGKPSVSSVALSVLTLALSLGGAFVKKVVATATYSDATTADVTAQALWTSSVPAKATVENGYVTGLVAGVTNVSATFAGVAATAPCVVTVGA